MSKPIFYEGQAVGCLISGEGQVLEIKESMVSVRFKDGVDDYFPNGSWLENQRPTLYPIDQYRQIIAKLPAPQPEPWKPKPGDWVLVRENHWNGTALLARFIDYNGNKYMVQGTAGKLSFDEVYPFVGELPEHLKEVQP